MILSSGKMLRPSLVILAGRYGRWEPGKILPLAAAVEMLHNATLVHDDIIDQASTRRGRPALHEEMGSSTAVLVGDYLLSCCFTLTAGSTSADNGIHLSRAVARICEGEINQNAGRFVPDFSIRNYRRRIVGKTAALFSLSLLAGAREAGCSEADCSLFLRIGYDLGMAFQIIDDILDYSGDDREVGKPLGKDLREGIYTLPLLLALKDDAGAQSGKDGPKGRAGNLEALVTSPPYDEKATGEILRLTRERGGVEAARKEAWNYTLRAEREIARLSPGYTRDMLGWMAGHLFERNR